MMKLIATHPILYLSRQYKTGDELPASDPAMVEAWTDAKTAVWKKDPLNPDQEDEDETEDTNEDDGSPETEETEPEKETPADAAPKRPAPRNRKGG